MFSGLNVFLTAGLDRLQPRYGLSVMLGDDGES
jgi:hypothetical protein